MEKILATHTGSLVRPPVVAPASAYWLRNEHYDSEQAFVYGLADVLREEYRAIVESGFLSRSTTPC